MPKEKDQILTLRVDAEFLARIDAWRETLSPIRPNRSDALRYLVDLGLEAATKGKKR